MPSLTLAQAGQISEPQECGPGTRVTTTGSGYVEWTSGTLADVRNGVATWQRWPGGSAGDYCDTLRRLVFRGVASGSGFVVTWDEGKADPGPEGVYWQEQASSGSPIDAREFGVKADGVTDDTAALQAAIVAAYGSGSGDSFGGQVVVPAGVISVSSSVSLRNRVRLVGAGKRSTVIKASASFSGTYVLYMDDDATFGFDSRVERLTIDCNSVASLSGIRGRTLQEGSGASSVLVKNYRTYGIHLSRNTAADRDCANTHWDDLELYCDTAGATAGMYAEQPGTGGQNLVSRVTCNSNGATNQTYGLDLQSGYWTLRGIHSEKSTTAVRLGANSSGVTMGLSAGTGVTTLLRLDSSNWTCIDSVKGSATNTIDDAVGSGVVWTDSFMRLFTPNTLGMQIQQCLFRVGTNSPEGVVSARVGSLFLRTNGGTSTTLYVKESGTGNTGWIAK